MCSHLVWILLVGSIPELYHQSLFLFTCEAEFSFPPKAIKQLQVKLK